MIRRAARLLPTLALLLPTAGCLGGLTNPICKDALQREGHPCGAPQGSRNRVYVFLIHGVDPLDFANLCGVREHLLAEGYVKTYYGQFYCAPWFVHEIRRIHKDDPEARFVLLGFSLGANMARDVAHAVDKDHIPIDLLVYCGGNTLHNVPRDRPCNALRIVNILACGCIWNGDHLDGALNLQYDDVFHFGSPAHPVTLQTLDEQLEQVAARVPLVLPEAGPLPDEPRGRPAFPGVVEPPETALPDLPSPTPERP